MNKMNKVDLFLDSGAFSAMTQGVKIDIYEYIDFIKEHEDVLEVYANLDVIGSAEGTWKNQMIMEEAGLKPLPVFHYGEDEKMASTVSTSRLRIHRSWGYGKDAKSNHVA